MKPNITKDRGTYNQKWKTTTKMMSQREFQEKTQENCQTLLWETQNENAVAIKDSNSYKKTENSHFLKFLIT